MQAVLLRASDDEKLQEELETKAHEVLRKWQSDQRNMGSVAREIFGIARDEGFKEVGEVSKKPLERLIKMAQSTWRWDDFIAGVTGGAGVAGGVASFAGESPWHVASSVLAAVGGTAIGIVVNGVAKAHKKSKESPFRYLTILEDRGVAFTVGA
jgi:hypothetical protein